MKYKNEKSESNKLSVNFVVGKVVVKNYHFNDLTFLKNNEIFQLDLLFRNIKHPLTLFAGQINF